MTIYFRADANSSIGLGHLTRLIALAEMLRGDFECIFLIQELENGIKKILVDKQLDFFELNPNTDYILESIELNQIIQENCVVVLDGYHFDQDYILKIKTPKRKIVLIDDFIKSFEGVDVIINHALGVKEADYQHHKLQYCLGAEYALLRPSFLEIAKKEKVIIDISKAFICFGGADTYNLTLRILQELECTTFFKEINVVLASSFPFSNSVYEHKIKSNLNIIIHENLSESDMANLMFECHFAIAPTSGLSYEICSAKMVFLGGYYVENQKAIHDGFAKKGCIYSLGDLSSLSDLSLVSKIHNILKKTESISELIECQKLTITGKSKENYCWLFKSL